MKEKGFTLVELLAVIVILAVLAVLATPIITGIIENSKKSGFKASLDATKRAIENYYATHYSEKSFDKNGTYIYSNGRLTFNGEDVEMSGTIAGANGSGYVDEDGNVIFVVKNDRFCGKISGGTVEVTDISKTDECKL